MDTLHIIAIVWLVLTGLVLLVGCVRTNFVIAGGALASLIVLLVSLFIVLEVLPGFGVFVFYKPNMKIEWQAGDYNCGAHAIWYQREPDSAWAKFGRHNLYRDRSVEQTKAGDINYRCHYIFHFPDRYDETWRFRIQPPLKEGDYHEVLPVALDR